MGLNSPLWLTVMSDLEIQVLLDNLKNPLETVRLRATEELWRLWFQQKGLLGLELLQRAQVMMETGEIDQAEVLLTQAVTDLPDFAEAWNRRAVLYYLQRRYLDAIADCQMVIYLNPHHFGALHGLGLSYLALGEYREAIAAFRQALEIQPYAVENQRLILECTAKLS